VIVFRKKALERIASPDDLDRAFRVITLRSWIPLTSAIVVIVGGLLWSLFGRIPITVNGIGVLVNPGYVRGIESVSGGQLTELGVRVGEVVMEGQLLATFNQPQIRQGLDRARLKVAELEEKDAIQQELEEKRRQLESTAFSGKRKLLEKETVALGKLIENLQSKQLEYLKTQEKHLNRTTELSSALHEKLRQHLENARSLTRDQIISEARLLQLESDFTDSELELAGVEVKLTELELQAIQNDQALLTQVNRRSDLQMQLSQLDIDEQKYLQELTTSRLERQLQLSEARGQVAALELDLEKKSTLLAEHSGHILELSASVGDVIEAGERIGLIEIDSPVGSLKVLAYFVLDDGNKVHPGMQARVTPTSVRRERFGAIVGDVTRCSDFPITLDAASHIIGSAELVRALTPGGGMVEVEISLQRDSSSFSGFKWTSRGPNLRFSSGTPTSIRITVENRRPISYLLPVFRTWAWGEKDESGKPR